MSRLLTNSFRISFLVVLVVGMVARVVADEPENTGLKELLSDGKHCVSLSRIDRTQVIDDSSILFYMQGGDIYLNQLPHRCPGLRGNKAFMYRTSLNRLCDLDIITVLDNLGFGFSPGPSCGLGMFFPIGEETASQLKAQKRKRPNDSD